MKTKALAVLSLLTLCGCPMDFDTGPQSTAQPAMPGLIAAGPQVEVRTRFVEVSHAHDEEWKATVLSPSADAPTNHLVACLSKAEYARLIQTLRTVPGVSIVSFPVDTVPAGTESAAALLRAMYVPGSGTSATGKVECRTRPVGVAGDTVQIEVNCRVAVPRTSSPDSPAATAEPAPAESASPSGEYDTRNTKAHATLENGSTLVLALDTPEGYRQPPRGSTKRLSFSDLPPGNYPAYFHSDEERHLFAFITVCLPDITNNTHPAGELPGQGL